MKVFYSEKTNGFYPDFLLGQYNNSETLPLDILELTQLEVEAYQGKQPPEGKILGSDIDGRPAWVDPPPKIISEIKKEMEGVVQAYIDAQAQSLGYDSINAIAKYLVAGNPFYEESTSLSIWCASVWTSAITILSEVEAGTRVTPTTDELIAELPAY